MANQNDRSTQVANRMRERSVFGPGSDPAVQQESLRLMRAALQKAGLESDKFEELKRQNDAAREEALAKYRAAADERAPAMWNAVSRSAENWLSANGVQHALADGVFYLDTADRIDVTPGFQFLTQNIAPWRNSAEVILDKRTSNVAAFDGEVTFSFSWQNWTGAANRFDVTGLLGVTAICIVTADGYWFSWTPPFSRFNAWAFLRITVVEDNGHVFEPPYQPIQTQIVVPNLVVSGGWGGVGTIASQDVFRTYVLQHLGLLVPANGRLELDLTCVVDWLAVEGGVDFLAAGNGRQLTGWGMIIRKAPWVIT
jgi:hypothetical protein